MAYVDKDMQMSALGVWKYQTTDAVVTTAGYFNAAAGKLRKGDVIFCLADMNNATLGSRISAGYTVTDISTATPPVVTILTV